MARELILEVIARKNSKALNDLADDFDKLAAKTDAAGKSLGRATTFSQHLDSEIAKTKALVRDLGVEFERTGSKDVFASLRGAQGNLRQLENIKKQLSSALTISPAVEQKNKGFFSRLELAGKDAAQVLGVEFEGGLRGALTNPVTIAAGAVAGALLGQAIAGGVLLGIGGGTIAAGIAAQLHDPRVAAAGHALGAEVSRDFKADTASFAQPLVNGIHIFDTEWQKLQPGLRKTFNDLAPLTTNLFAGAAGFADKLVPSLEKAAVASRPLIDDFARFLPRFGSQLGGVFDQLAAHQKEFRQALQDTEGLLSAVTILASQIGPQLAAGNDLAHIFAGGIPDAILAKLSGATTQVSEFRTAEDQATVSSSGFAAAQARVAQNLAESNQRLADQVNALLNVDQASAQYQGDLVGLKGALDAHNKSLTDGSAAAVQNQQALLGLASDAERVREAQIAAGGSVDQANAKFRAQISQIEALAIKLGLGGSAVHRMLDPYLQLVNAPNINKFVTVTYKTSGSPGSAGGYVQTPSGKAAFAKGGIRHAAAGMVLPPMDPGWILAGEPQTGGEALVPLRGISRTAAAGLLNTAGAGYGLGVVPRGGGWSGGMSLSLTINTAGTGLDNAMAEWFYRSVRIGAIAMTAGGQPVKVSAVRG